MRVACADSMLEDEFSLGGYIWEKVPSLLSFGSFSFGSERARKSCVWGRIDATWELF